MKASIQSVYGWENIMNNIVLMSLFEMLMQRLKEPQLLPWM
uniref:Alternative protein MYOM1 n=1 Tax=Homo sapiens TaxID=9606 RepID=L8E928_HUMAN|nr:alternative protein MYOM1 [Homo sapiens]